MREVELSIQGLSDLPVQRELLAVVRGHGVNEMTMGPEGAHGLIGYQVSFPAANVSEESHLGFPFDQGFLLALADHGVELPIANTASLLHNGGTLVDAHSVLDPTSSVLVFWALTSVWALMAEILPEASAVGAIGVDELVDGPVADPLVSHSSGSSADLLRSPACFQTVDDIPFEMFRGANTLWCVFPACFRFGLGILTVVALMSPVTLQLTAHGGRVDAKKLDDLLRGVSGCQKTLGDEPVLIRQVAPVLG